MVGSGCQNPPMCAASPPSRSVPGLRADARRGGAAALIAGFAALGVTGLEARRGSLGFDDADDPRVMLMYFREHADLYVIGGLLQVLLGMAAATAVIALWRLTSAAAPTMLNAVATVFGLFSSACFFAQGVLRVQSPGTILHIAGLDEQSGRAAYAAVQMAGTQGLGSAGAFALALWAAGVAVATWRPGALPRPVAAMAVLPFGFVLIGLFGPLAEGADALYPLYVLSATVGLPLWCVAVGVALLRLARSATPSDAERGRRA